MIFDVFVTLWRVMGFVKITKQQNLSLLADMKMVKKDVKPVRYLFIMMDYTVRVVI